MIGRSGGGEECCEVGTLGAGAAHGFVDDATLLVDHAVVLTGSVHARVVVCGGGTLTLSGTAQAGVVVTAGGYACIVGHTVGVIVARGGQVSLEGTATGWSSTTADVS